MIRYASAFFILLPTLAALGQPVVNPRIRIRVIGDDTLTRQTFGSELSSTVYVDEVGSEQKGQLDRIQQFLKEEKWSDAADMLTRLSETDLHKLVALSHSDRSNKNPESVKRMVPLSQVIQRIVGTLAQQSPGTLTAYRERVDPLSKRWLEQAREKGNTARLHQIVHEAFHSSYGDDALLMLGDRALERGAFDEARTYYGQIHAQLMWQMDKQKSPVWLRLRRGELPSSIAKELTAQGSIASAETLAFIDSDIPIAEVWSRMVLASILEENRRRASLELAVLRKAWPDAAGVIGGRQGKFATLLSQLLRNLPDSQDRELNNWVTFAGNFSRNATSDVEIDLPAEWNWKQSLEPIDEQTQTQQRSIRKRFGIPTASAGEIAEQPCRHFPIVFDGRVVYKDHSRLYCLDLETGEPAWSTKEDGRFYEQANMMRAPAVPFGDQLNRQLGQHRYTLCYANGLITATMGSSLNGRAANSTLVGFGVESQGAIEFGPIAVDSAQWTFHGGPLHDANRCWVGMRLHDTSAQDFLACYDIHSGEQLWRTRICTAETIGGSAIESTCNFLLTKHENTIFVSSHLGTIAAVSSQTGNIRWVTQYPRRGPKTTNLTDESWHALRDLTPCVIHGELLIAAPSDTDHAFALRRDTGGLVWKTPLANDATKILGISSNGQLIMSGRRLWWLDAYTGLPSRKVVLNPFPQNANTEPTGVGRGLLSGDNIYWPAIEDDQSKIYVLRQEDGKPARQPIDLDERNVAAGNLIPAPGYLLIAAPEAIATFKLD